MSYSTEPAILLLSLMLNSWQNNCEYLKCLTWELNTSPLNRASADTLSYKPAMQLMQFLLALCSNQAAVLVRTGISKNKPVSRGKLPSHCCKMNEGGSKDRRFLSDLSS